jgi:replicative DNA helicase
MFNETLERITRGREGLNMGLPMGFDRLREFVPDIQQGTYYAVGAEAGVGKSSFVNSCFVYNPFDWIKQNETNIKMKVIYYSFEIEKTLQIAKAICRRIYLDYGLLLDINYILSRGKNRITDEHYNIVTRYKDYFESMSDILDIRDAGQNPTGIWHDMIKYSNEHGKWVKRDEFNTDYVSNDPNLYTIIIIDHSGLVKKEQSFSKKENIDKLSEYFITLRNKCNFTPVLISQFNRALSSTDRAKIDRVIPQLSDFKETGNIGEDANIVFGLFNPSRYNIPTFRGYDITKLKNRFINLNIMKNRDGESDKSLGMLFVGEVGHYIELPKSNEMTEEIYNQVQGI